MKQIMLLILFITFYRTANAQYDFFNQYNIKKNELKEAKTAADSAWANRPSGMHKYAKILPIKVDLINSTMEERLNDRFFDVSRRIISQNEELKVRTWGINFWRKFPNDNRRFIWLTRTVMGFIFYWKNTVDGAEDWQDRTFKADIDLVAKHKWEEQYAKFRDEFMDSKDVPEVVKQEIIYKELKDELYIMRYANARGGKPFDYSNWLPRFISYADYFYKNVENLRTLDNVKTASFVLFEYPLSLGLNPNQQEEFIRQLANCKVKPLADYAKDRLSLSLLRKTPFKLKETATNGKLIHLAKLNKKIVLVDFWGTGCTYCIAAMPRIKEVYEKYKSKGFEVISIDISGPKYRDKVIDIHNKVNVEWPLITLDKTTTEKIFNTYNWVGVPKMLLLDEHGKLIMYNEELLQPGGLEKQLEQYFSPRQDTSSQVNK